MSLEKGRPLHEGVDWNIVTHNSVNCYFSRPLHEGVDWNCSTICSCCRHTRRPLHEGVDWNYFASAAWHFDFVALFTRAWIEILFTKCMIVFCIVALFTRAWIEIFLILEYLSIYLVALFTRAWIEIRFTINLQKCEQCRPLHEGVDWNVFAVFVWAWPFCRPLHEGVDWNKIRLLYAYDRCKSPSSRGRGLK